MHAHSCQKCGRPRYSRARSGLCRVCWEQENPPKPKRFCQQCQTVKIASHNKSGMCRACCCPTLGRILSCQQCQKPLHRKTTTGLCFVCIGTAKCCRRCGRHMHSKNRSGYCSRCTYTARCRLCHRVKEDLRKTYCLDCARLNRQMHPTQRTRSIKYRNLPTEIANEIEQRILHYQRLADVGLPLFGDA